MGSKRKPHCQDVVPISVTGSDHTTSVTNSSDEDETTDMPEKRKRGAVEVFCGCARLTRELNTAGLDAIGVDYFGNKDKPLSKSTCIDLLSDWGQAALRKLIKEIDAGLTWFAPPCGSASRALEIRRKHGSDPKPKRSDEWPDGLPDL